MLGIPNLLLQERKREGVRRMVASITISWVGCSVLFSRCGRGYYDHPERFLCRMGRLRFFLFDAQKCLGRRDAGLPPPSPAQFFSVNVALPLSEITVKKGVDLNHPHFRTDRLWRAGP